MLRGKIMERRDTITYCENCAEKKEFILKKMPYEQVVRDKKYQFMITKAFCKDCGKEVFPQFIFNLNTKEVDAQYRKKENIITLKEINSLLDMYKIGKTPLSLTLGFGEVTINRYFNGQVPSKEYSDIMRRALSDVAFMKACLNDNKAKIADSAYKKAMEAIGDLEKLFSKTSKKLLMVIAYIFSLGTDVTPLVLQKILYYVQSIYRAVYHKEIFCEPCEAWVHGPVYRSVYNMFKDFKYNPIDDDRFYLIRGIVSTLSDQEKNIINIVMNSFGIYSGKTLENITHKELPWKKAREGYLPYELSSQEITVADIENYFNNIGEKYSLDSVDGLKQYIYDKLYVG